MGIKVLAGIAQHGTSDAARVAAVALLFERGWGKAAQPHTGENGEDELRVTIRHITEPLPSPDARPALAAPKGQPNSKVLPVQIVTPKTSP